jgi:FkbH-like protein
MNHSLLRHPLDVAVLARKRRGLREELLAAGSTFLDVKIAILGGSTTADVKDFLEIFLLDAGIRPRFYVSQHDRWFEDAVVDDAALHAFAPDVVFIHTTHKNVRSWPPLGGDDEAAFAAEQARFTAAWRRLLERSSCLLVQNNMDPPALEPLGHLGATARFGRSRFVARLNAAFAAFADETPRMRIVDLHALAARIGLGAWSSERHWHQYRMALTAEGSAHVAHAVARIIRAAFGKTKKCLVLDLDNTLWGGVVGDDGVDAIAIGPETPEGEAYLAFQRYCLALRERGVLLAVCSKNDAAIARSGFSHRDSVLHVSDFSAFVASWSPKPEGLRTIARTLGLGLDALVFVDDNPAERDLVSRELPEVAVARVGDVTTYAETLDREGWFEPFTLGADDASRANYYAQNAEREELAARFEDRGSYLDSLEMEAEIGPFDEAQVERITQLANKTNQFNLTTRRYTSAQIDGLARNPEYVTLAARLRDRFGDNGLVSAIVGHQRADELHVELWIMSCRVFQRELELALFDALVEEARARRLRTLVGYYAPTPKNALVASHYRDLGFEPVDDLPNTFRLAIESARVPRNHHIRTKESGP